MRHRKPWAVRLHSYLGTRRSVMLTIALFATCRGLTLVHDPGITAGTGQAILYLDIPLPIRVGLWVGTSLIAAADASDTERAAVEAEFETFQGRVDNLGDRIEAEGLFGQEDEDEPGAGEPAPEPEPDNDDDTPTTEPPNDPGAVTF